MARRAVVLMNLGGPDSPAAVRPFLYNLFSDPAIIGLPALLRLPLAWLIASRRRRHRARQIYAQLGGASPLLANTEAQARALEAELGAGSSLLYRDALLASADRGGGCARSRRGSRTRSCCCRSIRNSRRRRRPRRSQAGEREAARQGLGGADPRRSGPIRRQRGLSRRWRRWSAAHCADAEAGAARCACCSARTGCR